jgi:hypothetical protein
LVLTTTTETMVAANFRNAQDGVYAAEAALGLAVAELGAVPDWTLVLDGSSRSVFVDGSSFGPATLADGSPLDLAGIVHMLNCRRTTDCSASSLVANTAQRPWGANNPVWRLYAYGRLSSLLPAPGLTSAQYVVVMVADDPSENDGDPLRDSASESAPGAGVLLVRAEAFGPRGSRQVLEATVARPPPGAPAAIQTLSWRLLR